MTGKIKAFTLIELLIVVAIIAILAAIAVPNFLEAQVRAKSARAKSDLRMLATGIESYYVDWSRYPPDGDDISPPNFAIFPRMVVLSTPVAYITNIPEDPFHDPTGTDPILNILFPGDPPFPYIYNTYGSRGGINGPENFGHPDNWGVTSLGPSRKFDSAVTGFPLFYDPSNGTISSGDIHRFGGERTAVSP